MCAGVVGIVALAAVADIVRAYERGSIPDVCQARSHIAEMLRSVDHHNISWMLQAVAFVTFLRLVRIDRDIMAVRAGGGAVVAAPAAVGMARFRLVAVGATRTVLRVVGGC